MSEHEHFLATRRFESLDGLRAISVIAVVWHHTAAKVFGHSALGVAGSDGVTLFFAISGFLITTLLLRERDRAGRTDLRAFYGRRTRRIFPLYYAVLAMYVIAVYVTERHSAAGQKFFDNLWSFATFTSNWFVSLDERTIFYFAWSLAAEEQFYLLWPFLLVLLGKPQPALLFVCGLAVALVAAETFFHGPAPSGGALPGPVDKIPLAIVLGSAGALALHTRRGFAWLKPWLVGRWHSAFYFTLLLVVLGTQSFPRYAVHIVSVLLVISACATNDHALRRLLSLKPLVYVGTISFGIYLMHMLAGHAAAAAIGSVGLTMTWPLSFVSTLLASVVAAGLSFRFFEQRFTAHKPPVRPDAHPKANVDPAQVAQETAGTELVPRTSDS